MSHAVYVRGTGMTKFGELWDQDLTSLGNLAAAEALEDSELQPNQIDALLVANMGAQIAGGQAHLGALFADSLKIAGPSLRVEGACASGGLAVQLAFELIRSGAYRTILVLGVEKMTDLTSSQIGSMLGGAASFTTETIYGAGFPALYAMIAREHMRRYGSTREDLATIAIKNHAAGALNPQAHFQHPITQENVLLASPIASPLGLLDCSPISDGAAAVVLSSEPGKPGGVKIIASQVAHDTLAVHDRADLCSLGSTHRAAQAAYQAGGITAQDISIAELHDCFTIAELIAYEDLGFVGPGQGAAFARKPSIPTNTSGGLKACGHPVGATGVKQIVELALQLSGRAGRRQIATPLRYGLAHNVGGSGATAVVTVVAGA